MREHAPCECSYEAHATRELSYLCAIYAAPGDVFFGQDTDGEWCLGTIEWSRGYPQVRGYRYWRFGPEVTTTSKALQLAIEATRNPKPTNAPHGPVHYETGAAVLNTLTQIAKDSIT